jgi:hypothetical protein
MYVTEVARLVPDNGPLAGRVDRILIVDSQLPAMQVILLWSLIQIIILLLEIILPT